MLKALHDYAIRRELTLPEGYLKKTIKAYISLDLEGSFTGIYLGDDTEEIPCPDIGSLANGKDKSNVLVEKRSVVIPKKETAKSRFFLESLQSGSAYEPMLGVCAAALTNTETTAAIREALDQQKIKDAARISFRIDGKSILDSEKTMEWWKDFRKQFAKKNAQETNICMITGEQTVPVMTTTPISGLQVVGGHARGDALICFDKNAFCSYGLKKAQNAPVSEQAFAAVKAALDDLLKKDKAPIEAGAKFVHWYDIDVSEKEDIIAQVIEPDDSEPDADFDTGDDNEEIILTAEERETIERANIQKADSVIQSVRSGEKPREIDCNYFILMVSGVGGRIMIRRYERGNYQKLKKNIEQWYEDLALVNSGGTVNLKPCKLTRRLMVLLKYQKVDNRPFERIDKELSGITPAIIMAILNGTALPDSIAARALANIRSKILSAAEDESNNNLIPDPRACQWLKVWLIRKNKEGMLMNTYNMQHPEPAYHCGGLMAVYARIQERAMEGVNAGVIQRYYASASRTPALVLSQLNRLSNYHLDKLENSGYLKNYLEELYTALGDTIPVTLTLEQQSYFALGYYQMSAKMNAEGKRVKQEKAAQAQQEGE